MPGLECGDEEDWGEDGGRRCADSGGKIEEVEVGVYVGIVWFSGGEGARRGGLIVPSDIDDEGEAEGECTCAWDTACSGVAYPKVNG